MIFVISDSDGDTIVTTYDSEEKFLKNLRRGDWGDDPEFIQADDLKTSSDTGYWGSAILIIRGDVTPPKPKIVVEEWEL